MQAPSFVERKVLTCLDMWALLTLALFGSDPLAANVVNWSREAAMETRHRDASKLSQKEW